MLRDSNTTEKRKLNIPTIQKYLFFAMLAIAPIAIMPFPWDWTERSMSLVILGLSIIIVGLELVKLIWEGKVTLLKSSLDGGILALLVSLTLSTIFSRDINTSLWGIDGRLGSGLIVFMAIVLVCLCTRTFFKNLKDIKSSLMILIMSFSIVNILSIFSFLGVNVWGFIPVYKDLFQVGLPLLRSSKMHLLVNFILLIIDWGFIVDFILNKEGKRTQLTLTLIAGSLSAINIWIFSINQGIGLILLFILLMVAIWFFGIRKLKLSKAPSRNVIISMVSILLTVLLPTIILLIPSARNIILPKSVNLVAQVSLGADVSWVIAASVFVTSFGRGLLGMGVDTYSLSYNLLKPLSQSLLQYNNVNFYYAGSEILTKFANGGLIWLLAWGFFGFVVVKTLVKDLGKAKIYKDDIQGSWYLLFIDFTILYIFLSSLFAVFNVLTLLIFVLLIALRSVLLENLSKGTEEKFVVKLWTANLTPESETGKGTHNLNIVLTILIACLGIGLTGMIISKTISSAFMLKAESYYVEQNNKYADKTATLSDRDSFVTAMAHYYSQAAKFDSSDPLANRKTGLMYLEMVGIAAEKYSKSGITDSEKTDLVTNVGKWKNYALDYTRKSIDTDSAIYSNWESRAQVYMGLVGMGFSDYASDALYALDGSAVLNPLNYELYYSEAQVYVINKDNDSALTALTKALSINAQHIPSLMLAATINKEKGNTDVYESYLKAAKKILENGGQTDTDVYKEITKELNALSSTSKDTTVTK